MKPIIRFTSTLNPDLDYLHTLVNADPKHPHIHRIDMPYRLASTWQDCECKVGLWETDDELVTWAVFLPPWWNLDYAILPEKRGTFFEKEIFAWGQEQMIHYAKHIMDDFYGSVEFFADTPKVDQTKDHLDALGFKKFDWSTIRFGFDLQQDLPNLHLPDGYSIRPLHGPAEVETYVNLHQAAFRSDKMTTTWRMRMLKHPSYKPEIDLVIADPDDTAVGFCICWMLEEMGQIEPLSIHPDYQGIGLGSALEIAALHFLRNHGARFVYVDHVSLNEKAIALSLQTGFKQTNDALRYFIDVNPEL